MHGVPERVLLRHLLAESGGSRIEAARHAGVGRSTMYRWIAAATLPNPRIQPTGRTGTQLRCGLRGRA